MKVECDIPTESIMNFVMSERPDWIGDGFLHDPRFLINSKNWTSQMSADYKHAFDSQEIEIFHDDEVEPPKVPPLNREDHRTYIERFHDDFKPVSTIEAVICHCRGVIIGLEMAGERGGTMLSETKKELELAEEKHLGLMVEFWKLYPEYLVRRRQYVFERE